MGIFKDCAAHLTGLPVPGSYRAKPMQSSRADPKPEPMAEPPQKKSRRTIPTGNPTIDIPLWFLTPKRFSLNPFKGKPLYEDEI